MILSHIRLCTSPFRFYHAMIIKKEDEPEPNFYASVFMSWDEDSTGKSKYKRHFKGVSEKDVIQKLKDFLKENDGTEVANLMRF